MEKTGGSRLLQMQARFQQKQMQEREMKIANLYEAQQARALDRVRNSPSGGQKQSPPQNVPVVPPHQPGKVRQMFEERRTKAGIDKSYPLQPIHNTDRPALRKTVTNGHAKVTTNKSRVVEKKVQNSVSLHSVKKQQKIENKIVNSSGDLNHNHQPDMNSVKQTTQHHNGEFTTAFQVLERVDNNYLLEDETFPDALAPLPTPRSPEPRQEPKRPPRRSPNPRDSPAKTKAQPAPVAPPRKPAENGVANRSVDAMQRAVKNPVPRKQSSHLTAGSKSRVTASTPTATSAAGGPSGAGDACAVCGRHFAPDRLQKHQDICKKSHAKKRKPFDVLKHRLAGTEADRYKGTEAEPLIGKIRKNVNQQSSTKLAKPLNNNWRQKHEEFIQAIRAAKQVQQHLNAGGKLSDLPPPPPSENPDYVKCPHCSRRFNQAAAERHIPKCASYQFNKPKPAARKR